MARHIPRRTTRRFQLRLESQYEQDVRINDILTYAKKQRREVEMIRDAIDLYYALEQGNLEALYSFFPQYKGAIGNGAGDSEIKAMLELIISRQKAAPAPMLQPVAPPATGKLIGGFKPLAAPVDDDLDGDIPSLTVKKNVGDASANFLESLVLVQ